MVAARVATLERGSNQYAPKVDGSIEPSITQPQAANLFNVSRESVKRARKVLNEGVPELVKAVEQGIIPVSVAARAERKAGEALAQLERGVPGVKAKESIMSNVGHNSDYARVLPETNTPPDRSPLAAGGSEGGEHGCGQAATLRPNAYL
jgi:hypothetical protein